MGGTTFGSTDVSNNTGNTTFRIGNNAGVVFVNGDIDMSGGPGIAAPINRIRNVRDPIEIQDVATKYYVDKQVLAIQQFDLSMGPTGPIGPPGIGDAGLPGPGGASGPTGCTGPRGPTGDVIGVAGLPGPTGAAGATGVMGPAGATGAIGPVGAKGDQGIQGVQGIQGSNGAILWLNPDGDSTTNQLITDSYLLSTVPMNSVMRTVGPISVSATYGNANRTIPGSRFYNTATQVSTLTVIPSGVWSLNLYANVPSNSDANQISLYAALFMISGTTNQPSPDSLIIETKDGGDPGFYPPRAAYLPDHVKYISQSWSGTTNILDNSGGVIINSATRKLYKIDMPVEFTSIQDSSGNRANVYVQLQIYIKNTKDRNQTASVSLYFQTDPDTNQTTYSYLQTTFGAVGIPGPQGPTGSLGPAGTPGVTGQAGITGTTGAAGPTGFAGPAGPIGPLGPTGPTGPAGQSTSFGEQYSVQYRSNPGSATDAVGAFGGTRNFRYEPGGYTKSVSDATQGSVILNDLACRSIHSPFYVEDPSSSITGTRPRTFIRGGEVSGIPNNNYVIIASGRDSTNVSQNTPGSAADITHGVKLIHNYDDSTARINLHNGEKASSKIGMKFDLVSGNIISSQDQFCIVYDSGAVGVGGMTPSQMTDLALSGLNRKLHIRGNVMVGSHPGTTQADNAMIMLNRPTNLPATTAYPGIYHRDISSANAPSFNVGSTDVSGLSIFSPNFITFQTGRGATQNNSIVINTAGDVSVLGRTNLTGAVSVGKGFTSVTTHDGLIPVIDISGTMSLSSAITNYIDQPRVKLISNANMKNSDIPTFSQSVNEIRGVVASLDSGFLRLCAQTPSNSCIELIGENNSSSAAKFNNSVRISTGGQDAMIINGSRNVGIGTSEPGTGIRLDVVGTARVNSGAVANNALTTTGRVGINNASPGFALDVSGGAKLVSTGGLATNIALTTTGWVGINNASPGVALDVSGGANLVSTGGSTTNNALTTTGRVGINNASPGVALDVSGGANLVSTGGSTTNNALTTTGRVGINNASPGVALDVSGSVRFGSPTSTTLPNGFFVRTGGSNWRDYIPLHIAVYDNIIRWNGQDTQWYDINNNSANEIAIQYSYFAGYWLNANRAVVGTTFSVESYAIIDNGYEGSSIEYMRSTFTFRATTLNNDGVVTGYTGRLSTFSDPNTFYNLTPRQDGIIAGVAIGNVVLNVTGTARIAGQLDMFNKKIINVAYPSDGQDAVNKYYVDNSITTITNNGPTAEAVNPLIDTFLRSNGLYIAYYNYVYINKGLQVYGNSEATSSSALNLPYLSPSYQTGTINIYANYYGGYTYWKFSDKRLKKNITPLNADKMIDIIRKIQPVTYNHSDLNINTKGVGFIAQDLVEIFPESIHYSTNAIPNNQISGELCNIDNIIDSFLLGFKDINKDLNYLLLSTNNSLQFDTNCSCISKNIYLFRIVDGDNKYDIFINSDEYISQDNKFNYIIGATLDVYRNLVLPQKIEIFGQYINNFMSLHYDSIWTVATGAIQEVDRQQQADKARIAELENQVSTLEATVATQQSLINDILERLKALERA
jgi:hypothetical protein